MHSKILQLSFWNGRQCDGDNQTPQPPDDQELPESNTNDHNCPAKSATSVPHLLGSLLFSRSNGNKTQESIPLESVSKRGSEVIADITTAPETKNMNVN